MRTWGTLQKIKHWVVVAAVLVMFMQAGFALLEAGLTRMKNAGHIAGKNVLIFGLASLVYWAVGFGIAFGDGNAVVGTSGFIPSVDVLTSVGAKPFDWFSEVPGAAGYLFEVVFAGVSLAIVWGVLAALVAITAASGHVAPWAAVVTGLVPGVIAVVGVIAVERIGIDDPIGAVAVHHQLGVQALGVVAVGAFTFAASFSALWTINTLGSIATAARGGSVRPPLS